MFTIQERLLLIQHINALKHLMRDVQKYGIVWLQGDDRIDKARDLQQYYDQLLSFERFVISLPTPTSWVDLYARLVMNDAEPIQSIFSCLDGLERLTNYITDTVNRLAYINPLAYYNAVVQHRMLKNTLIRIIGDIICNNQRDSLFYLLAQIDICTDFYNIKSVKNLKEILQNRHQLCLIVRASDLTVPEHITLQ